MSKLEVITNFVFHFSCVALLLYSAVCPLILLVDQRMESSVLEPWNPFQNVLQIGSFM